MAVDNGMHTCSQPERDVGERDDGLKTKSSAISRLILAQVDV